MTPPPRRPVLVLASLVLTSTVAEFFVIDSHEAGTIAPLVVDVVAPHDELADFSAVSRMATRVPASANSAAMWSPSSSDGEIAVTTVDGSRYL